LRSSRSRDHRGSPALGTLPHFSRLSLSRIGLVLIFACLAIYPLVQISPRPVGASNPTFPATIANYAFKPQHINATTGTQVIWTNNDGVQHTVTSSPQTNMTQGGGPLINSGPLNQGQSFSYTFYKHGFYPYQCGFHPYMTGWVNVTGSDVQPPSSSMTTSSTDYTPYIIVGIIAAAIVIVSVALFLRRRTQKTGSTSPVRPT
jgi:plastocyanin